MNGSERRRSNLSGIGDLLSEAMSSAGLTDQARRFDISRIWREAVGPRIAERTAPYSFNRGTLVVKVASAAWQNELTFLKTQILEKVNRALGGEVVRELRVLSGRVPDADSGRRKPRPPPEPCAQDLDAARETAKSIGDEEIRKSFARAMALDRHNRRGP